jgi:hypothetical protein
MRPRNSPVALKAGFSRRCASAMVPPFGLLPDRGGSSPHFSNW